MLKRIFDRLLIFFLATFFVAIGSATALAHHDPHIPGHETEITHFTPLGFAPGRVMAINGGPFVEQNGIYGSRLFFSNDELPVFFESDSRLVFVPPLHTACGTHPLYIDTTVDVGGQPETSRTELREVHVECRNLKWEGPAPNVEEIRHSGHVTAKLEPIYVIGENITPYGPQDGFPNTVAYYTMGQIFGIEEIEYLEFGHAKFTLDVDHCGTYVVELRNYHRDANTYSASGRKRIEVTNNCDGIPPVLGNFNIELSHLPAVAQLGQTYEVTANVHYSGGFPMETDLEVYDNGTLFDMQKIQVGGNSSETFRFEIQFFEPGVHDVEVKVGEASTSFRVDIAGDDTLVNNKATPSDSPMLNTGELAGFDTDNDCIISEIEFFDLMDAWLTELIDDALFFNGVDAWVEQGSVCAASSSPNRGVSLQMRSNSVLITAGAKTESISAKVYDLNGRVVFAQEASGHRLHWNLRNNSGNPVANGVYFVSIEQLSSNSEPQREIRKFIVMR